MPSIDRMIAEIESYLASAAGTEEERRILQELLEQLRREAGHEWQNST